MCSQLKQFLASTLLLLAFPNGACGLVAFCPIPPQVGVPLKPATQEKVEPKAIPLEQTPHEMATLLLHRALHESVWGPPAASGVRQQMEMYGHRLNGYGKYVREGEGTGRLKLILQFPAGDSLNSLFQVSDGQRLHSVEDIGGVRKRTIVDLDKVRDRIMLTNDSVYDPVVAMYLAIGGQAEALRKLCQRYVWHDVRIGKRDGREVWILSGKKTDVPPAVRAMANTDKSLFVAPDYGLAPTEVRVYIGKATGEHELPYWLYQVEQRQVSGQGGANQSNLQLVTEWTNPTKPPEEALGAEFFQANPNNEPIYEETEDYLPPPPDIARMNLPPKSPSLETLR